MAGTHAPPDVSNTVSIAEASVNPPIIHYHRPEPHRPTTSSPFRQLSMISLTFYVIYGILHHGSIWTGSSFLRLLGYASLESVSPS